MTKTKSVFAIQPYQVGSKRGKSLAIIIPSEITKKYNIDKSTVLTLRFDEIRKTILLRTIDEITQHHGSMMSAGESLEASSQQTSCGAQ